jgi:hypothetical protein
MGNTGHPCPRRSTLAPSTCLSCGRMARVCLWSKLRGTVRGRVFAGGCERKDASRFRCCRR